MTPALTLVIGLLLAEGSECHFVTGTRILELPSCDIGPATIAELSEDPSPSTAARARALQSRSSPTGYGRPKAPAMTATVLMVRGNEELERRLAQEQRERIDAVAERLAAEKVRDQAIAARDQAIREANAARAELKKAYRRCRPKDSETETDRAAQPATHDSG